MITKKIVQLHLTLLIPSRANYIIKSDSINVDCQLLGEKYTSVTMTIEGKVLYILCQFEFIKCINHKINYDNFTGGKKLINNTYKKLRRKCNFQNCTKKSQDNMFSYYMNQNEHEHDDKDDIDELKFT